MSVLGLVHDRAVHSVLSVRGVHKVHMARRRTPATNCSALRSHWRMCLLLRANGAPPANCAISNGTKATNYGAGATFLRMGATRAWLRLPGDQTGVGGP